MTTTTQICDGCGRVNASVHSCAGSRRVHGGVGAQLAALRAEVDRLREENADLRSLIATMQPAPEVR